MALGGEMHHEIGLELLEGAGDRPAVADIGAKERIARVAGDRRERVEIAGVGQLVEDEERVAGGLDDASRDRRSDEAGAAGQKNAHDRSLSIDRLRERAQCGAPHASAGIGAVPAGKPAPAFAQIGNFAGIVKLASAGVPATRAGSDPVGSEPALNFGLERILIARTIPFERKAL